MMNMRTAALGAALAIAWVGSATAQTADQEYRRYCTGDYQRLCSMYSPSSPEVGQCFQARFQQLSQYCRDTINKWNPKRR